jgi:hypothetical protein
MRCQASQERLSRVRSLLAKEAYKDRSGQKTSKLSNRRPRKLQVKAR